MRVNPMIINGLAVAQTLNTEKQICKYMLKIVNNFIIAYLSLIIIPLLKITFTFRIVILILTPCFKIFYFTKQK